MECKQNVVLFSFYVRLNFGKKKLTPALFVNNFCSPKVTTALKLRPPKAANSKSNEGRYYRNSTVCQHKMLIRLEYNLGVSYPEHSGLLTEVRHDGFSGSVAQL